MTKIEQIKNNNAPSSNGMNYPVIIPHKRSSELITMFSPGWIFLERMTQTSKGKFPNKTTKCKEV